MVTKRLIDLDDRLLADAQAALGTSTISATVRQALQAVSESDPGQAYVDMLSALPDLGPDARTNAWRTGRR